MFGLFGTPPAPPVLASKEVGHRDKPGVFYRVITYDKPNEHLGRGDYVTKVFLIHPFTREIQGPRHYNMTSGNIIEAMSLHLAACDQLYEREGPVFDKVLKETVHNLDPRDFPTMSTLEVKRRPKPTTPPPPAPWEPAPFSTDLIHKQYRSSLFKRRPQKNEGDNDLPF